MKCLYLWLKKIKIYFKMFQVSLNISVIYNGIWLRTVCANVNCLSCLGTYMVAYFDQVYLTIYSSC